MKRIVAVLADGDGAHGVLRKRRQLFRPAAVTCADQRLNCPEMFETKRTRLPSGLSSATGWKRRNAKNCSKGAGSAIRGAYNRESWSRRFPIAGTRIRRSSAGSRSASSAPPGSTSAISGSCRSPAPSSRRAWAARLSWSPGRGTTSCARSSTSAVTAASRSRRARQAGDAAVRVPRVDVRARRLAPLGAAVGRGA